MKTKNGTKNKKAGCTLKQGRCPHVKTALHHVINVSDVQVGGNSWIVLGLGVVGSAAVHGRNDKNDGKDDGAEWLPCGAAA